MSQYSLAVRWRAEELRSIDYDDLDVDYVALGGPMEHPIINYRIQNFTDENILISYDGTTDHDIIGEGGFVLLDVASNKGKGDVLGLAKGDQVYVKAATSSPTSGYITLSAYYASNN